MKTKKEKRDNAAARKKRDKGTWCRTCGRVLNSEKDKRRKRCPKCQRLETKRWRSPNTGDTRWRGRL